MTSIDTPFASGEAGETVPGDMCGQRLVYAADPGNLSKVRIHPLIGYDRKQHTTRLT